MVFVRNLCVFCFLNMTMYSVLKRCVPSILMDVIDTSVSAFKVVTSNGTEDVTVDLGPLSTDGSVDAITGATMEVVGK